ncbi:MAG: YegS/Rv2252/BmrU family lipid kinase [Bacteroidetes bacterium]|nr:YegS/Rv2252/BmrU family lipid kinase [Bacteroidota bacterium]
MKRVLAIGNPFAHGGRALQVFEDYRAFLLSKTDLDSGFYLTQKDNDIDGMSAAIRDFNPDVISVIGGDGTVNDVVNVTEARDRILHLIPAGSGNDFSRLMNGELNQQQAFDLIHSDKTRECDIGICNDRWFLNGVGIGFDGSVARQTVRMKLPFSTTWKYWIAIFRNVLFYRSTPMIIESESLKLNGRFFMISIANGTEYGGGFRVSPLSLPDDGFLDLVTIGPLNPIARLFQIPAVEKGKHLHKKFVQHQKIRTLKITSDQILYAHLDGELMNGKEYVIKAEGKVRLLVR